MSKGAGKAIRRSISLPPEVDIKIRGLARRQNRSANRVIEHLIEAGLEAKETEKRRFFELADRLRTATEGAEVSDIKNELARLTFGE